MHRWRKFNGKLEIDYTVLLIIKFWSSVHIRSIGSAWNIIKKLWPSKTTCQHSYEGPYSSVEPYSVQQSSRSARCVSAKGMGRRHCGAEHNAWIQFYVHKDSCSLPHWSMEHFDFCFSRQNRWSCRTWPGPEVRGRWPGAEWAVVLDWSQGASTPRSGWLLWFDWPFYPTSGVSDSLHYPVWSGGLPACLPRGGGGSACVLSSGDAFSESSNMKQAIISIALHCNDRSDRLSGTQQYGSLL